nr:MAG TPA: hypothetical protein [Caudoviricetes sp.]
MLSQVAHINGIHFLFNRCLRFIKKLPVSKRWATNR